MINQYQKSLLLIFLLFSTILLGKNKKTLIEAQDDTYTVTYSTDPKIVGSPDFDTFEGEKSNINWFSIYLI